MVGLVDFLIASTNPKTDQYAHSRHSAQCHTGIGKPEPLRYERSGWWSRRIDQSNRLVYRSPEGNIIEIASCKTHYEYKHFSKKAIVCGIIRHHRS